RAPVAAAGLTAAELAAAELAAAGLTAAELAAAGLTAAELAAAGLTAAELARPTGRYSWVFLTWHRPPHSSAWRTLLLGGSAPSAF
ncbi:MAG: hypothetical protein JWL68_4460, partial [Actinomycetia bacterium]|nr:hypothetical protein [Actinomycetes bacterium]